MNTIKKEDKSEGWKEYAVTGVIAIILILDLFLQFIPKDLAIALFIIISMGLLPRDIWNWISF